MKVGLYWSYATRSLLREGQRTLLALFCVAVGVMAIVSLQLVGNMVNLGLTGNVRDGNGGDISVRSDITPLTADQVKTTFDKLVANGEITQYTAVSAHEVQADSAKGDTQFFSLRAIDPAVFPIAGAPVFSTPSDGSLGSLLVGNSVVVNKSLLQQLGMQIGDSLSVTSDDGRSVPATIAGIVENSGQFQRPQMLIALDAYAALRSSSGLPVDYSAVYVNVPDHSDANANTAKSDIDKDLPQATVTTTKDALQQQQNNVQNIRYFLQIVGLLSLLIGGVGIMNTMQVLLRRRQTEIAMLKTTGYRQRDLYALFGLEATLLGVLGGILGAGAGIGVSYFIKGLAEKAFFISLPAAVDPFTVASGVVIGFFTALIFGLMPIVQASQIRPLAVLRSLPEGSRAGSRLLALFLALLLGGLFFVLAYSILRNLNVALGAVIGVGIFLALQSVFFAGIVWVITHIPVPERLRWTNAVPLVVLALVFVGLAILFPTFAPLCGGLAAVLLLLVAMPRTWKANVKLALRNIGRQRIRTITTMVALLVGVFGVGLIFVLGQNIQEQVNVALLQQGRPTALIIAGRTDKAAVDQQVGQLPVTSPTEVNSLAQGTPVFINYLPMSTVLQNAPRGSDATHTGKEETGAYLSGLEGFDVANGKLPDFTIVKGTHDSDIGRNLAARDAGSGNVLVPQRMSLAPLNLQLDSVIGLANPVTKARVTLRVVGFYDSTDPNAKTFAFASMLTDSDTVTTFAGGTIAYVYSLHLDPTKADQQLHELQKAVPSAFVFNVSELLLLITNLLNNFLVLLYAVMSLAVIAGLIIIANAVALAMLERRRELGILKATGFTSRSVLSEVLVEYGVVGLTGGLLAMLIVAVALLLLGKLLLNTDLSIATYTVLAIVLGTAAVCMLIASLVARGATRVRPLEVLRYE
jgi:predicted lysophospholipase L1 biosynthesis ABC-type transport system permease subunit